MDRELSTPADVTAAAFGVAASEAYVRATVIAASEGSDGAEEAAEDGAGAPRASDEEQGRLDAVLDLTRLRLPASSSSERAESVPEDADEEEAGTPGSYHEHEHEHDPGHDAESVYSEDYEHEPQFDYGTDSDDSGSSSDDEAAAASVVLTGPGRRSAVR
jgi:hypothetical protein